MKSLYRFAWYIYIYIYTTEVEDLKYSRGFGFNRTGLQICNTAQSELWKQIQSTLQDIRIDIVQE